MARHPGRQIRWCGGWPDAGGSGSDDVAVRRWWPESVDRMVVVVEAKWGEQRPIRWSGGQINRGGDESGGGQCSGSGGG